MRELLRFEWRYHTRRVSFLAASLLFLCAGLFLPKTGYGPDNVTFNAPSVIMQSVGLLSLLSIFALTVFGADAALRDGEHRMAALVFATPVTKLRLFTARFLGALMASSAAFAFTLVGLLVGVLFLAPDPARVGPVHLLDYAWAFALLALPNLLFAGALLFGVALVTRSAAASYVAGVLAYILYFIGAFFSGSPIMAQTAPLTPQGMALAAVLDPFGLAALFEQTHHWLPGEHDVRRVALAGNMLLNRGLWTGVSLALLAAAYALFKLRLPKGARRASVERAEAARAPVPYRPLPTQTGGRAMWAALRSTARLELRTALLSWPFLSLMALWVGSAAMELVQGALNGELGTPSYPTTALMLELIQQPLMLFGALLLVYYSAEVVWRERLVHVADLVDATPVPSALLFLAKAVALWQVLGVMALITVVPAVAFQLASGLPHVALAPYLSLGLFVLLPLALLAVAALFVQTLSPHRHVGMLLNLVLALVVLNGDSLGLEHPLVRYAGAPRVSYGEMSGYGPELASFLLFMAYWTAFAALLALVTAGLWRRGRVTALRERLRRLPVQWGRGGLLAAGACAVLLVATGAFAYHASNVRHGWESSEERTQWRVDYERSYGKLQHVAQPQVVGVRAAVDLFPEEGRYAVQGSYRLRNETQGPIDTVWVTMDRHLRGAQVAMSGARLHEHDVRFGTWVFALQRALQPGEETELTFEHATASPGLRASDFDTSVVENGSYLTQSDAFPEVGFQRGYLLRDPDQRRLRGLPVLEAVPGLEEANAPQHRAPWATFETTVSTSADQLALAPGKPVKQWEAGGRRYFQYASDGAMTPNVSYASARYEVKRVKHGDVDVEVYFHPAHGVNVPRMLEAATRSLDLFSRSWGPYPHASLRIVEVPGHWPFGAYAQAGVVYLTEDRGFLTDLRQPGTLDLVTKRVAHEVAHQWWGHRVDPPQVQGRLAIVETLAKYGELRVLEELYGEHALRELRTHELQRYLAGRAAYGEEEPALHHVVDEAHVYYAKGALVLAGLQEVLGTEALDRALRRLVETKAYPQKPTSLDLLAVLQEGATPEQRALVDGWMKERIVYDLAVREARCVPEAGGFRVKAVLAAKRSVLREGKEVSLPLDEPLEVALLSEDPERGLSAQTVLQRARLQVRGPLHTVELRAQRCPAFVAVDPFLRRVDRDRMDNVLAVGGG
jgi:ABC-2 type transport system permease protein